MPMFQYDEPGTIISLIRKKWFSASKAWMAPARRTATTAAPIYIARLKADADVPIRRAGHDHFTDQEEMVQRIEGVDGSRAAHCHNGRADLHRQAEGRCRCSNTTSRARSFH